MKEKLNKIMRQGRVVTDKGPGKKPGRRKASCAWWERTSKCSWPQVGDMPHQPSEGGTGLSPVPDSGGCWHLLYLVLVSPGCWLPNRCCWEEEEPWGHRELVASLVCVWSSLHKLGPEGFCGKGQSLLGHVSASLSVAAAVLVALLWADAVCSAYWLEIAHSCSREKRAWIILPAKAI